MNMREWFDNAMARNTVHTPVGGSALWRLLMTKQFNDDLLKEWFGAACEAQETIDTEELESFCAAWRAKRACCAEATLKACVCIEAWTCPVHGETHRGSHE